MKQGDTPIHIPRDRRMMWKSKKGISDKDWETIAKLPWNKGQKKAVDHFRKTRNRQISYEQMGKISECEASFSWIQTLNYVFSRNKLAFRLKEVDENRYGGQARFKVLVMESR